MSNELTGVIGVFAFTLILFVLRVFYLTPPQRSKVRDVAPKAPGKPHEIRSAVSDDNWLLRIDDLDREASSDRVGDSTTNLAKS